MNWVQGDATDCKVVDELLKDADAAVHAIGKFFDPYYFTQLQISAYPYIYSTTTHFILDNQDYYSMQTPA